MTEDKIKKFDLEERLVRFSVLIIDSPYLLIFNSKTAGIYAKSKESGDD